MIFSFHYPLSTADHYSYPESDMHLDLGQILALHPFELPLLHLLMNGDDFRMNLVQELLMDQRVLTLIQKKTQEHYP